MQTITTIGFDIAKSVFQVHGVDAGGQVIIRRQLKRRADNAEPTRLTQLGHELIVLSGRLSLKMVGAESYQERQAAHEVMGYAKDQINKRKCIEALVLHAKIERMSRLVGRVAIAVFIVSVFASVASVFFKCIGCGHGQY